MTFPWQPFAAPAPPTPHAPTHQNGGTDEVATTVAAVGAIPKADPGGALAAGWIDDTSHGARGGGALHALVVPAGAAGFMGGPDKTKLDGIAAGAAALTAAAPTQIDIGDAGAVGVAITAARADHEHALPAPAAPVNVTKAAAAAGVATTTARADHKHDVTTAVPGSILIGAVAAEGVAVSLARSDHTHALAAPAAPATVGTANATGAATAPARADHVHDHGVQPAGAGTQHAVATAALDGFLTAADFAKLARTLTGSVTTVGAVTSVILTMAMPDNTVRACQVVVTGRRTDVAGRAEYYRVFGVFRQAAGVATLDGATQIPVTDRETVAAWNCTITVLVNALLVNVTGSAGATINWTCELRYGPEAT